MKTYSANDLWALADRAYYGYIRHFWDPRERCYVSENGHAASGTNCVLAIFHVLRHLHNPHAENVERVRRILDHVLASHDTYGSGGLLNSFDDPGQGGGMRNWLGSAALIALALILKHAGLLGIDSELRAKAEFSFNRYFALADALMESWDRRDNQSIPGYFLTLAYAYWCTGNSRFLDQARRLSRTLESVYTTDEPLAIRNTHRGCFPDWTWWYAQAMDYLETGGASPTSIYQNGGLGVFAFGHRLFTLAGVTDLPWLDYLRKVSRLAVFNNIAANGFSPYIIETYQLPERYNVMALLTLNGPAVWMQTSPERLRDQEWAGRARFLFDRGIESFERLSDADGAMPKSIFGLNDRVGAYSPPKFDNNVTWLHVLSQIATFADLDSVKPAMRRYWDWRWFWDQVHVHGESYDAYLAGWTNKRREDRGAHQKYARAGHPPNSWVDPLYVGGSIARLFTHHGAIVFPLCVNRFGWRVETDEGVFDSTEACMGRKAEGYTFTVEVDGKELARPADYGELEDPLDFESIRTCWRVECGGKGREKGEMIVANTFLPERIDVENCFIPRAGLRVRRIVQSIPFTRAYCAGVAFKRSGSPEEIHQIDWRGIFTASCREIELSGLEYIALVPHDRELPRTIITFAGDAQGKLILNDGEITDTWMDGWNYIELARDTLEGGPVRQRYAISVRQAGRGGKE